MKIILTGSLGHIGAPLTQQLVAKGHSVTVVSSQNERRKGIEELGAAAAIGRMEDKAFLADVFKGADRVYLMLAVGFEKFFDPGLDLYVTARTIAENYKYAVEQSAVKNVIYLSTIGAHTEHGVGMLKMHHYVEQILGELPNAVRIKFMRPVGFYTNMFGYLPTIRSQNAIVQNYGGDEKEPWVSPADIASVIAEEMDRPFSGRTVRYIASDEVSPNTIAKSLGMAIGKPDLQWVTISDDEFMDRWKSAGMNPEIAEGFTRMNAGRRSGVLYEDYFRNRPTLGHTKLEEFAKQFSIVFNN